MDAEELPIPPLDPLVLAEPPLLPPAAPEEALPLAPDEPLIPDPEPDDAVFSFG